MIWRDGLLSLVTVVLGVLAYTDWRWRRIPNVVVVPVGLVGLGLDLLAPGRVPAWGPGAVIGAGVVLAVWLLCEALPFARGGFGAGDAKLLAALCLLVGPVVMLVMLALGLLGMCGVAVARKVVAKPIAAGTPLAPALAGAWVVLLTGMTVYAFRG